MSAAAVARRPAPADALDVEAIRAQFPILRTRVHDRPLVYLDSAASTQKPSAVIEAQKRFYEEDYAEQFLIRIPECLAKLQRMEEIYATVEDTPQAMSEEMAAQRKRLEALRAAKGDYVSPFDL